jgi:hypothetical protein
MSLWPFKTEAVNIEPNIQNQMGWWARTALGDEFYKFADGECILISLDNIYLVLYLYHYMLIGIAANWDLTQRGGCFTICNAQMMGSELVKAHFWLPLCY